MSDRIELPGSHIPTHHQKVGPAASNGVMTVTLMLRRKAALRSDSAGPKNPQLDRATFADLHGIKDEDLATVRAFALAHGLAVREINRGASSVRLSGTVEQIQQAFGVTIQIYRDEKGISYRSNDAQASLPAELGAAVEHVLGLSERAIAKPHVRLAKVAPASSFTPPQLASTYQFPLSTGAGQCIGIVELGGGYQAGDLQSFFAAIGEPVPSVLAIGVDGANNVPGGDPNGADPEVELDIEVAGGIAPGASIAVYFAPNTDAGFLDAITTAIHDAINKPSVISISWGGPEDSWTPSSLKAFDEAFHSAALLGITVCAAAGDNGSSDGTAGNMVDFPASSPHVLACGGTTLMATEARITSETVWNDGGGEATGGGISAIFPVPSYQGGLAAALTAGGKENLTGRGVPDVAGNADPKTGYAIFVDGKSTVVGGTSAVAPLWAGLIARINSLTGKSHGFINPILSAGVGRDVTSGNNGTFAASAGWDACTGWGSPNGTALMKALGGGAPASPASTTRPRRSAKG